MRKIDKGTEPASLAAFKKANPTQRYPSLSERERQDIRQQCTHEQFYLCAYCCQTISGTNSDTMNEHVVAQAVDNNRTLDFGNIVASCVTPRQCDAAHGSQSFELTPLMHECETELRFMYSGRVQGATDRARQTIQVLNLGDLEENNKALIEKRKQLVSSLIWNHYGDAPDQLTLEEDSALVQLLIDDLLRPADGRLAAFSPVLVSILREQLDKLT